MLYKGDKIPMNKKKAAKYFQKSIDATNNEESMFKLAFMLKDGDGIPKDKEKAFKYFKILSEQGNKDAMLEYSFMLIEKGHNLQEALKYFKISADLGNIKSMVFYARLLYIIITKEKEMICKNFNEKADKNQIDLFFEDIYKSSEVIKEISKYYKMAFDLGNKDAIFEYGYLLYNGLLDHKNNNEAIKCLKMAADKGSPEAAFLYGLMLLVDDNASTNMKESIHYIQFAIKEDNFYYLGIIYMVFYYQLFDKLDIFTNNDIDILAFNKFVLDILKANCEMFKEKRG